MEREYSEEVGARVASGDYIGSLPHPHPARQDLQRHFYAASYISGNPYNRVPLEHEACMLTDVENAIVMFGDRVPEAGKAYLRAESVRLSSMSAEIHSIALG